MRKALEIYCYLFYRFYRFFETSPSQWWSEWKAGLLMTLLFPMTTSIIIGLYEYYFNIELLSDSSRKSLVYPLALIPAIVNYFLFAYRNKWKLIIANFDKLPSKKQFKGKVLFWLFITVFIIALVHYLYLMSNTKGNIYIPK